MNATVFLESLLSAGVAQCSASLDGSEGLLAALFIAGLTGGAMHCVGMCGPFVLSQVQARFEAIPATTMSEFKRIRGGALLPAPQRIWRWVASWRWLLGNCQNFNGLAQSF